MSEPTLALQLYTLRHECQRNFRKTLQKVADAGFREIELSGTFGLEAGELAKLLQQLKLRAIAGHFGLERMADDPQSVAAEAKTLGLEYAVCGYLEQHWRTPDGYAAAGKILQKTADELAGDGVKVAYHHHDFELKSLGDDTGLDRILASSSGERVALELDTYWLWRSGRDPAVFMREVGERCRLLHLKDGLAGGGFTELGSGVLDWHEILGAAADIGGPHLILEQDECSGDRFRSLKMSLKNFEALRQEARS